MTQNVTYQSFYAGGWIDAPSTATPIVAAALQNIETGLQLIYGNVMQIQAASPVAGVALTNGLPTIATWTPPNDGNQHRFNMMAEKQVATLETGGQVVLTFTGISGTFRTFILFAGGAGAGNYTAQQTLLAKAGTAVTVFQSTALTAGASTVWAEIWGV